MALSISKKIHHRAKRKLTTDDMPIDKTKQVTSGMKQGLN